MRIFLVGELRSALTGGRSRVGGADIGIEDRQQITSRPRFRVDGVASAHEMTGSWARRHHRLRTAKARRAYPRV
jgi:hypothetical protein